MRLGLDNIPVNEENLKFAAQVGIEGILAQPITGPDNKEFYEFAQLVNLKTRVESYELKLEGFPVIPWHWSYKWMLGLPGRDEQIENCQKSIRNMGAAGIPIFIYNAHALRFYRTSSNSPERGGALATSFDNDIIRNSPLMAGGPNTDTSLIPGDHRHPVSDEEMWNNLTYFLKAVVPVAEESGVKLALHPDDPPIPSIGHVARIMRSPEAFRRVIEMFPSDNVGLSFCQGCFAEMGANVVDEISYFGSRNKIFWAHFRNISGTANHFSEAFPDTGQVDMLRSLKAYKKIGYNGYLTPDHKLGIVGDSEWGHRYWAYAIGYMKGLMQDVDTMVSQSD